MANRTIRVIASALAMWCCLLTPSVCCADSVDVVLPASVSFNVTDITQSTTGLPNPSTVSFTNYVPGAGSTLRIGIQSNTADFTRPVEAGATIPCSNLSWTCGAPSGGGQTYGGTLADTSVTQVYQGTAASNSFDITWTLAPLDPGIRAGTHTLTATWRVESF